MKHVGLVVLSSLLVMAALVACVSGPDAARVPGVVNVVAAENFYGDIVKQLGGSHVSVTSIISNPNVDPHEFESSVQTAILVSNAQLVIENGLGYDSWMDKVLAGSPAAGRIVLVAGQLANHKLPDNPHVWYGPGNMPVIAQAITSALKQQDSKDSAYFENNLTKFVQSLGPLEQKMAAIKAKYAGTPVALTETIYLYQSMPEGLDVLTPVAFMKAIAEGNDPPANTVVTVNNQINKRQVKILIYNAQTITPITTNLQSEARQHNIPVVPVTETMPPDKTYQAWMSAQLDAISQALQQAGK
ncbi:MAG TPA: zinc ABC transporter substrate-binding protein [Ktedonobacteraceae bacterium]|nr:zinc ABC transporter substrate-binding protein [Ktedonobacteraceae bacterium]